MGRLSCLVPGTGFVNEAVVDKGCRLACNRHLKGCTQ